MQKPSTKFYFSSSLCQVKLVERESLLKTQRTLHLHSLSNGEREREREREREKQILVYKFDAENSFWIDEVKLCSVNKKIRRRLTDMSIYVVFTCCWSSFESHVIDRCGNQLRRKNWRKWRKRKELPSVQAQRRRDSKYLPHHSRNHSSKTQIYHFFYWVLEWMSRQLLQQPHTPIHEWAEGSSFPLTL